MSRVSIIIPTYNAEKTIEKCLKSIFNQTFKDFEIVVVNDGSTDQTVEIVEKFKCTIIEQENKGAPAARNNGFKQSRKTEFVLFCDDDLVLRKDCLQKMVDALQNNPQASYAYCSFKFGWKKFKLWEFNTEKLKQIPYIHTTSLIRTEHFPGWDESINKLQDWDLWLTMLKKGHTGVWIPQVLFKAIDTKGTMSTWLPSFVYKLPWKTKNVKRYEEAVRIIKAKHNL